MPGAWPGATPAATVVAAIQCKVLRAAADHHAASETGQHTEKTYQVASRRQDRQIEAYVY